MVFATLRRDERIGLGIALAAHVALGAALLMQPATRAVVTPPVDKMVVNLASDAGLQSAAPEPVAESRAPEAPTLAPEPAPAPAPAAPTVQPAVAAVPPPRPVSAPQPRPAPVTRPVPRPVATPPRKPAPASRATARPVPRATARPVPRPAPAAKDTRRRPDAPASAVRSAPSAKPAARPAAKPAGASRIGADFLPGAGTSTATRETRIPASQIGASAKASLVQSIAREIKPKWQPPEGPDVDKITTFLRFRLAPDGSLQGRPELVRQTGINDTNRAQASRHAEQAIRAVQLAAPFNLPDEHYNAWKLVGPFSFDWKLAQ